MSRSCQSGWFSKPTRAFARTTRASPEMRSQTIGLRLCGIAEMPFWPTANGSSASRTSLRCRWRISTAKRSRPPAITASVASKVAWRSRATTWVAAGSTSRPRRSRAIVSTRGSTLPYAPTAPESLPTRDAAQGIGEPLAVAVELEPPAEQLEPERRRLGVHPVRATHARRVAVLLGAPADDVERAVDSGEQQLARLAQDEGQRGVDDVR